MFELTFKFDRETKGALKFEEEVAVGAQKVVGSLYLRKDAVGEARPSEVLVTVRYD
jgi:hypothetical protein|tara:strand:+ start:1596 stop:1763 length:168 start_codon:yes stop_codon:yes gene_type:complete